MTTLRWLHLSDFHTGKDGYGQSRLFQNILEHVKSRVESGLAPNFVFITGDIANKGKPEQYKEFTDKFFFPLIDVLPPDARESIFIIPGNHDVDRDQNSAFVPYDVLLHTKDFLDPTEIGEFRRRLLFPRFQAFTESDATNFGDHWLLSPSGVFTKTLIFGESKIGILGINTGWLSYSDNDQHRLSAGKWLIEEGLNVIKDCNFKFILGHHPIDWFLNSELEAIRSLFGRHNVLYMHGHLHKGYVRYEDGAGYPFLALQSGSCFQAREDDIWVNGFTWCELDVSTRQIFPEPLVWSSSYQEWKPDTLAYPEYYRRNGRWEFSYPLPSQKTAMSQQVQVNIEKELSEIPNGWTLIDKNYLRNFSKKYSKDGVVELDSKQVLNFFNGSIPTWLEALSPQIPKREIVRVLAAELDNAQTSDEVHLILLIGAAGEGKTTALLQTVSEIVTSGSNWNVLWRYDTTAPLPAEFIARLPQDRIWLIVSDDTETIARRVFESIEALKLTGRHDIHFLLSCRDTDWKAEKADKIVWKKYAKFIEKPLRGLSQDDAKKVLSAWSRYGEDGLKSLNKLQPEVAVDKLLAATKSEPTDSEGSFLGAILQVRLGEGLKDHVWSLLNKLSGRFIDTETTLKDAFAYIVAMHIENLQYLSREVLAEALGMDPSDLNSFNRKVLRPLGEEAAIATTGYFIFTRHRAVAEVAATILSEDFEIDIDSLYVNLVQSARKVFLRGYHEKGKRVFVPNIGDWSYLSSYFFNKGEHGLGIKLAQAALDTDPDDPYFIAKLSQLYREAKQPEQSVEVFFSASSTARRDRGYYFEWGTAEGNVGHHALSACLSAFSLSDEGLRQPPDKERARISLAGLSIALENLYTQYGDVAFIRACGASAQLGLLIRMDSRDQGTWAKNDKTLRNNLNRAKASGFKDLPVEETLEQLKEGVLISWKHRETELPEWLNFNVNLNFAGLVRLLQ